MPTQTTALLYQFKEHAFSLDAKYAQLYVACDTPLHTHHDFYEFSLITYGSFVNEYKGKRTLLPKNSLIFYQQGEMHSIMINEPESLHFSFILQKDYFEELLATYFPKQSVHSLGKYLEQHLTNYQTNYLIELSNKLTNNSDIKTKEKLARLFFFTTFTFCTIPDQTTSIAKSSQLYVENLINKLNNYAYLSKNVCDIYKDYPIAKSSLIALFKKKTGYTIIQYQNKKKMEYAAQLLNTNQYNITDIVNMLNFTSLSHFAKLFKECYGMPPSEYQRLHTRQYLSESDEY